jgi:ribonuclease HII
MKYPNFIEEKKLWKQNYKNVVGIDEAGRGPLAGPVVTASVCFEKNFKIKDLKNFNINDSKKLSEKQREELYKILTNHKNIKWGVGIVSEKVIDKINILQATKLAMEKSFKNLNADFLLIDGNLKIHCATEQKSIIKGDAKVFSIAAASIIAKVTRDKLMQKYHKKYPEYNFLKNKGYGTKAHFVSIEKFGPCKIHRKSFYPINKFFVIK